jgi:outer membrane lipoprotein-sorting protein
LVIAGVALLVAAPTVVSRLPVQPVDTSAQELLAKINQSTDVPYSGYAESVGGLALPEAEQLSSLTDLFGDTTRVHTWRRSADNWRVDTVAPTGERDLYRDSEGTWSWDFESNTAVRSSDLAARLPRAADLVPAELGRRLLSEAAPSEVRRLAAERIAGRDAAGLQLRPTDARSTISSVDVWADPASGVPLRVLVHSVGEARPVITSSFLDFSTAAPNPAVTSFTPPPGAKVRAEAPNDLIAAAQRLTNARTPQQLAGLPRREGAVGVAPAGAVGAYGRGVTAVVAVALPGRSARDLRTQLSKAPTAQVDANGVALTVGPLNIRLTDPVGRAPVWLLAGTVTPDTLSAAATELRTGRGDR